MEKNLQKHLAHLQELNNERKHWLGISVFVIITIIGIVFNWDYVVGDKIAWITITLGLTITVLWWYWTMKIVRHLLESKNDEYELLNGVVQTIKEIKEDVKNLPK
jgi:hypothetical protein